MIHYRLVCKDDHEFEGWFRSSADFDVQAEHGFVACPHCGSTEVFRALMAPAVKIGRAKAAEAEMPRTVSADTAAEAAAGHKAVAMADPRAAMMIEMLRRLRRHVEETAENVGGRFTEEARKIHYGEAEERGIYGEASPEDVEALIEEGVAIHPLPLLPEDHN